MKILCHVGPWCSDQFKTIAEGFDASAKIRFVSGFRKLDQTGLVDAYYKYINAQDRMISSDPQDEEVILRCRLMRAIPNNLAKRHVSAMRQAIREMLLRESPDVFICESVDQYLHDLLFQETERLGVVGYGLIRTFVNGYFRISTRGEMQVVREPNAHEVSVILTNLIDDKYIPQNLVSLKRSLFQTYFKIYISNHMRIIYFAALRWITGEVYNYHYWSSILTTKKYYAHIIPRISFGDLEWRRRISKSNRLVIFIPLQHVPEATVDYWAEDVEMVDYENRLIAFINNLNSDFQILVKEHPGVWGFRKPSFYRAIERANSSFIVCPAAVSAQECVAASDAVLVWTGSVGFEAALRGKAVLTTCIPYYSIGSRFKKVTLTTANSEISDFIRNVSEAPITIEEQITMVRNLLCGIIAGTFKNDGKFDRFNQTDIDEAKHVGKYLRHVYDRNIH